jgi:hypothetical protein
MRVRMGVLMHQGKHSLGRLFRGSELLHALKLCLACCYVTPWATPFAQTHPFSLGDVLTATDPRSILRHRGEGSASGIVGLVRVM